MPRGEHRSPARLALEQAAVTPPRGHATLPHSCAVTGGGWRGASSEPRATWVMPVSSGRTLGAGRDSGSGKTTASAFVPHSVTSQRTEAQREAGLQDQLVQVGKLRLGEAAASPGTRRGRWPMKRHVHGFLCPGVAWDARVPCTSQPSTSHDECSPECYFTSPLHGSSHPPSCCPSAAPLYSDFRGEEKVPELLPGCSWDPATPLCAQPAADTTAVLNPRVNCSLRGS